MTEDELLEKADLLIQDFKKSDPYLEYRKYKKAVQEDEKLKTIEDSRRNLQKGLKYLPPEKKRKAFQAAKDLQAEYDTSPLVVNLKAAEKELKERLSILTEEKL